MDELFKKIKIVFALLIAIAHGLPLFASTSPNTELFFQKELSFLNHP